MHLYLSSYQEELLQICNKAKKIVAPQLVFITEMTMDSTYLRGNCQLLLGYWSWSDFWFIINFISVSCDGAREGKAPSQHMSKGPWVICYATDRKFNCSDCEKSS